VEENNLVWEEAPEQRNNSNSRWRGISADHSTVKKEHVHWESDDSALNAAAPHWESGKHESAPPAWRYNNPTEWRYNNPAAWKLAGEHRRTSAVTRAQRRTDTEVRMFVFPSL